MGNTHGGSASSMAYSSSLGPASALNAAIVDATIALRQLEDAVGSDTSIKLWRRRRLVGRLQRQRTWVQRLGS